MNSRTKIILVAIGIISSLYFYKCYKEYYAEYDLVKNELSKIEGIKIINIDGNPDLTLEDIYATIELKNGNKITFGGGLTEKDFRSNSSIEITKVNNWEFHAIGCIDSSHWGRSSINVGEHSDYPEIKKLNIKNIKDVITHFDELNNVIKNIATYPYFDTLKFNNQPVFFQKYNSKEILNTRELKWIECR